MMTRDREVSESIPIHNASIEGAIIQNSFGSANCFSYEHLVDDPSNHLTNEEANGSEETDLSEASSRESTTPLPIDLLPGEKTDESADFVDCRVVLTNFRLCILSLQDQSIRVISLMSIDSLNFTDPAHISIVCKDGKLYRLTATSNELAIHWHRRLMKFTARAGVGEAFAWEFATAISKEQPGWLSKDSDRDTCQEEWDLLGYDPDYFKISDENKDHSLIETYPSRIIVPNWMGKEDMEKVKEYRFLGRIPCVVYVFQETKAVLLRSSQPKSGFLAWRNGVDEKILQHCNAFTKRYQKEDENLPPPDSVIMDARSYAAAWANRAKGGGFENPDCYGNAKSMFLGLPNIHSVRYAFSQLRTVLSTDCPDQNNHLPSVSQTQWLQHCSNVLNAANECVELMSRGTSILVHCSDGWDRTTQIVSIAKVLIDDRYRTLKGFELLIRREWIEFGHKFADRNGVYGSDTNERCPVFLQWLDAVWQVFKQNPTAFEFNSQYIIKLAQHVYSGLFGTFLFNSVSDAVKDRASRERRPVSIWQYLGEHNEEIVNQMYDPVGTAGRLSVKCGVQFLEVWRELYYTELGGNVTSEMATVISSPTLAGSAISTPLKDLAVLPKSKSSESISSIGTGNGTETAMNASALQAAHSESNGALNENHPVENNSIMSESMLFKRDGKSRSLRSRRQNVKDLVDHDGMIKYYDPQQEVVRRQKRQSKEEKEKLNGTIIDLQRHRQLSENTSSSLGNRSYRDRMISGDDSELDGMSIDNMSLVDNNEISVKDAQGWVVGADQCDLCRLQFNKYSYKAEDREHHCRKCGKAVCLQCSNNQYHSVSEGKSVYLRACNRCYQQMQSCDEAINEEDEESSGSSPPERMIRLTDESFGSLTSSSSLTQPVKG